MEIAHGYMNSFLDMKKYPKGLELDSTGIGDLFGIEDLLDLSNEEIGGPPIAEASMHSNGLSAAAAFTEAHNSSAMAGFLETGDICVPCEDLAQLEWLSNFVEESFSSPPAFSPELIASHEASEQKTTDGKPVSGSASPISVLENSSTPMLESYSPVVLVRGRARSKRSRTGVCFWNTRILSTTDTAAGILESPATSASSAEFYAFAQEPTGEGYSPPAAKKPKNSQSGKACRKGSPEAVQQGRRCLHCGIQRTPQWRAGPMGPKTLCNACGVRYKSGRLLPEYRPAASPTFVETIHSNSHRKVLELRRKKGVVGPGEDISCERQDDDNVHVDEVVEEEDQLELITLPMCERPCTA